MSLKHDSRFQNPHLEILGKSASSLRRIVGGRHPLDDGVGGDEARIFWPRLWVLPQPIRIDTNELENEPGLGTNEVPQPLSSQVRRRWENRLKRRLLDGKKSRRHRSLLIFGDEIGKKRETNLSILKSRALQRKFPKDALGNFRVKPENKD